MIKKFNILFKYTQNWRESKKVKETRVIGVPRNAENILYGKLESKGTGDFRDGMYRYGQAPPRGGMYRTQDTAHRGRGFPYKGEYSEQRREVQRGLGNRHGMYIVPHSAGHDQGRDVPHPGSEIK